MVAKHGISRPRGQVELAGSRGGRFGRMFPLLPRPDPGEDAIEELARRLINRPDRSRFNKEIPAGYTYLGQFVDHDITFDPTSKLQRDNDPEALVNFRTPRFDLDSLYGSGPADQPFLYDWCRSPRGVKLLVGDNNRDDRFAAVDLPRNQQGRALIGDARNDENLIVSQLHLLFITFHNKVVDWLKDNGRAQDADLFDNAQRLVRWHYQWIVVYDFLPKIVGIQPPTMERRFYTSGDEALIPVEFSGAAFRFGHSMVREDYQINDTAFRVPLFARQDPTRHLGGRRRLPTGLTIEWHRFFDTGQTTPQLSKKIDTRLAKALSKLPEGTALARLNLQRGRALGLPSGRDVATAMGMTPLTEVELDFGGIQPLRRIGAATSDTLLAATPLWYYILREAEEKEAGKHLGPVGGRIVAEVLTGLLEADPNSYLRQWPTWKPELPGTDDSFTMADLVRFTEDSG